MPLSASSLMERTNRSQWAFKFGCAGVKGSAPPPLALSSSSKAWVNFVSLSWIRYRLPRRKPSKGSVNCRAHCCMKAAVGCGRDAGDLDAPCGQVHDHEHVVGHQTMPCCHLHREKVRRSKHLPVQLEKLRPAHARLTALRGGLHVVTTQDIAHGDLVDVMAEVRQGTLDAPIAPGGVLLGHLDDELLDLLRHGGRPSCVRRVLPSNFCAMSRLYQRMRVSGVASVATSLRRFRPSGWASVARRRRSVSVRRSWRPSRWALRTRFSS